MFKIIQKTPFNYLWKKARELSCYGRIEMGKRDNDKDYIEIVNEAGISQKLLFKTSNIEAQNLMVHFEGGMILLEYR